MPLIETTGSASAKALGLNSASGPVNYIEDVFSTYLYTGTGANQTITNGVDLSTYGGMVWTKRRDNVSDHKLIDSARGWTVGSGVGQASPVLKSNLTNAQANNTSGTAGPYDITAVSTTGYSIGPDWNGNGNTNTGTYASWTFRKQPKFFDVVTYTGNGANRTIAHNLGSVPGCIIIKRTDGITNWNVYHRSLTNNTYYMLLNTTDAQTNAGGTTRWNSTTPTSTVFSLGTDGDVNANGGTYVAYLFAHDAGGFGASGTDNVISCGSYTGNGSANGPTITLGYEPQWVLIKNASQVTNWFLADNMRGWTAGGSFQFLGPNLSNAEGASSGINLNSTGFSISGAGGSLNGSGNTLIYIAIRRGPMKTPTSGTSVFTPATATGSGSAATITGGPTPTDFVMYLARDAGHSPMFLDRLRGSPFLNPASTSAESSPSNLYWDVMNGYRTDSNYGNYATSDVREFFKRAPSFMDVVCYTGTGSATTVTHNLTVAPELIIVKCRNQAGWNGAVYAAGSPGTLLLDQTSGAYTSGYYAGCFTSTSSTNFGVNTIGEVNGSGNTYVAWMWASCPGVSKVGSYTGTAGTQTISCGFAARFVLIKRTDSTGSWWVWDTARGMVSGTDPRLALQVANPEVNANWVYTDASGFQIVTTDATVNASGGSYIFLAVA